MCPLYPLCPFCPLCPTRWVLSGRPPLLRAYRPYRLAPGDLFQNPRLLVTSGAQPGIMSSDIIVLLADSKEFRLTLRSGGHVMRRAHHC
ncbi:hypothetical protein EYF80_065468 [Liparis tanakae]|uniref:Uncharacterized protein n=1 Tax=Liparis tanakae TaxID=230148 RepID=A0A4Z2E6M1_9TELE|nr:hypothetical protein EYF80_065468 [Liparis tanakae]